MTRNSVARLYACRFMRYYAWYKKLETSFQKFKRRDLSDRAVLRFTTSFYQKNTFGLQRFLTGTKMKTPRPYIPMSTNRREKNIVRHILELKFFFLFETLHVRSFFFSFPHVIVKSKRFTLSNVLISTYFL